MNWEWLLRGLLILGHLQKLKFDSSSNPLGYSFCPGNGGAMSTQVFDPFPRFRPAHTNEILLASDHNTAGPVFIFDEMRIYSRV